MKPLGFLVLFTLSIIAALAATNQTSSSAQAADGSSLPSDYRAVAVKVWWYDLGKAAVRGQKGIIATTNLLRRSPFAEWTLVYYKDGEISENTIVSLMKRNHCPNAARIRHDKVSTTMNPVSAAGDSIQIRLKVEKDLSISSTKFPQGWLLDAPKVLKAGTHYLTIRTPQRTASGKQTISLKLSDGSSHDFSAEIVKRVP